MSFDFDVAVNPPFRMQPGLRRLAPGSAQLTPLAPGSRHQREKLAVLSAFADPMYLFMDAEYNQFEVEAENMGDAISYLEDNMGVEVVFYDGKAISVELPTTVVREISTEPAVKGDTSRKVMKPAKIATGFEIAVPLFVENGDKIEIDTRTHEYKKRV